MPHENIIAFKPKPTVPESNQVLLDLHSHLREYCEGQGSISVSEIVEVVYEYLKSNGHLASNK